MVLHANAHFTVQDMFSRYNKTVNARIPNELFATGKSMSPRSDEGSVRMKVASLPSLFSRSIISQQSGPILILSTNKCLDMQRTK